MQVAAVKQLAGRIQVGIAEHGLYVLHTADLAILWSDLYMEDPDVKRMQVKNFAQYYRFSVRVDRNLATAVFRGAADRES